MTHHASFRWIVCALLAGVLAVSSAWAAAPAPKSGGVLNAMHREDPPSLSIIEEATVSVNWGVMPCYNNLVMFDPAKSQETPQAIVGDLAEKWEWRDAGKTLAFTLHRGVRWLLLDWASLVDWRRTVSPIRWSRPTLARACSSSVSRAFWLA